MIISSHIFLYTSALDFPLLSNGNNKFCLNSQSYGKNTGFYTYTAILNNMVPSVPSHLISSHSVNIFWRHTMRVYLMNKILTSKSNLATSSYLHDLLKLIFSDSQFSHQKSRRGITICVSVNYWENVIGQHALKTESNRNWVMTAC